LVTNIRGMSIAKTVISLAGAPPPFQGVGLPPSRQALRRPRTPDATRVSGPQGRTSGCR
jgi:hypothetical protein